MDWDMVVPDAQAARAADDGASRGGPEAAPCGVRPRRISASSRERKSFKVADEFLLL